MIRVEITVKNVHFIVTVLDHRLLHLINTMASQLSTYAFVFDKSAKMTIKQKDKEYFSFDKVTNSYRFTISLLKDFILLLGSNFVTREQIKILYDKNVDHSTLRLKLNKDYVLRDYQIEYSDGLVNANGKANILVDLQTGKGKASSVDSLVRIPGGWKRMGDIKQDDLVIAKDGTATKVTAVYPQGELDLYKITFADGRTHECCGEHLWHVKSVFFNKEGKVLNTLDLINRLKRQEGKTSRYYIDLPEPENLPEKELDIDPYVLGVILGDGCIMHGSVKLTVSDPNVIERVKDRLFSNYTVSQSTHKEIAYGLIKKKGIQTFAKYNMCVYALKELGLYGKYAHEKFIPKKYLNASKEQKYELIRGLMDTDGDVSKDGSMFYNTTSLELAKNTQELIRSLGGICAITIKYPHYTHKGIKKQGRVSYRLRIRVKNPRDFVTRKHKRLDRLKISNQYSDNLQLRIISIEPIGKKEAQCISIEHKDRLYVTGDYVVTHNTVVALASIVKMNMRCGILILPKYIDKWLIDLKRYTDVHDDDIFIVQGMDSLLELMDTPKRQIRYKFIIFSMRTIYFYIENYENMHITYPITPDKLMNHLGIGTMLNDEAHQEFFSMYKAMLYFDVKKLIGLSATLDSNQSDIKKIYKVMYPDTNRLTNIVAFDNYIHMMAINYKLENLRGIQYKRPQGYNHILFEQSLMRNSVLLKEYIEMIIFYIKEGYSTRRHQGEKLLIFAASIKFCTLLTSRIKSYFKNLDVRRYVEDDPYDNLMNADVCVSTIASAGTAVDIPGLITVINTVSMSSLQANVQAAGRLRKIPNRDVRYYYIYTKDIKNQYKMHLDRYHAIKHMSETYTNAEYFKPLKTK